MLDLSLTVRIAVFRLHIVALALWLENLGLRRSEVSVLVKVLYLLSGTDSSVEDFQRSNRISFHG